MSAFSSSSSSSSGSGSGCSAVRVVRAVPGLHPRGGASLTKCSNGMLLLFGGADREATHFNDLWVQESVRGGWRQVECSGDVPMPRAGHSAAAYGPYLLLFGGTNAAKGADYNDLYILDTATWAWHYVGEAGAEICARNSHCSAVLRTPTSAVTSAATSTATSDTNDSTDTSSSHCYYLVVFGGASMERGPLGDTYLARLPAIADVAAALREGGDLRELYVTWEQLSDGSTPSSSSQVAPVAPAPAPAAGGAAAVLVDVMAVAGVAGVVSGEEIAADAAVEGDGPCAREMQAGCCLEVYSSSNSDITDSSSSTSASTSSSSLLITGGRDRDGRVLSDVWELCYRSSTSSSTTNTSGWRWERRLDLELPEPLCSHIACCCSTNASSSGASSGTSSGTSSGASSGTSSGVLVVYGGFTGEMVSDRLRWTPINTSNSSASTTTTTTTTSTSTAAAPAVWSCADPSALHGLEPRFGSSVCESPAWLAASAAIALGAASTSTTASATSTSAAPGALSSSSSSFVLFGGVNDRQDFSDVWLIAHSTIAKE